MICARKARETRRERLGSPHLRRPQVGHAQQTGCDNSSPLALRTSRPTVPSVPRALWPKRSTHRVPRSHPIDSNEMSLQQCGTEDPMPSGNDLRRARDSRQTSPSYRSPTSTGGEMAARCRDGPVEVAKRAARRTQSSSD